MEKGRKFCCQHGRHACAVTAVLIWSLQMEAATVRGDLLTVGASFNTKPKHARQQREGIWTSGQGGHLYGRRVQLRCEATLHCTNC